MSPRSLGRPPTGASPVGMSRESRRGASVVVEPAGPRRQRALRRPHRIGRVGAHLRRAGRVTLAQVQGRRPGVVPLATGRVRASRRDCPATVIAVIGVALAAVIRVAVP